MSPIFFCPLGLFMKTTELYKWQSEVPWGNRPLVNQQNQNEIYNSTCAKLHWLINPRTCDYVSFKPELLLQRELIANLKQDQKNGCWRSLIILCHAHGQKRSSIGKTRNSLLGKDRSPFWVSGLNSYSPFFYPWRYRCVSCKTWRATWDGPS